jgi:class 3 adenylate cyclase
VDPKQPIARAAPFRLFVCVCLIGEAGSQLAISGQWRGSLLLLVLCVWMAVTRLAQRWDRASTALLLHLAEAATLPMLLIDLPAAVIATTLPVVLAGAAASGGWRFGAPCLLVMLGAWWLVGLPNYQHSLSWLMSSGFLLSLALVSFGQAQRLHLQGAQARRRSEQLGLTNAFLEKYLPSSVRQRIRLGSASRQAPQSCWVTVTFIDLVGFTAYVRERPPAEIVAVIDGYQVLINRLVTRYGGELGKILGDGALIYFPENGNRAMDARQCLLMLRELPALLDELNNDWRQQGHLAELAVRVGVASGYCALGDWGGDSDDRLDHCVIGDCVNLAARLQQAAEPGGGLVCEVTAALMASQRAGLENGRLLGDRRWLTLKGLGQTPVYPLVDAGEGRL